MSSPPRAPAADAAVATLVAADAVDKLAALAIIARATGGTVVGSGTARPRIPLRDGVWIEIEIPKFGEPPPLAIDVHASEGQAAARSEAIALRDVLRRVTEWSIVAAFPGDEPPAAAPTMNNAAPAPGTDRR
ncbi:hypothetical protein QSU92_03435 [Microbacterium sp. ET2]|uniref:hypothetical protein n=1 Tax=Microbacterium albipurpureum TaxID=3050384 RepID=UPI00259CE9F4|nr:hypothetical protein [Microbacterium sp. ET2 (Ac-2212)]WJL96259.1 hypothetical protein QSU92_03435 [Microbacterium sp. ET2 (Ac-2212)]